LIKPFVGQLCLKKRRIKLDKCSLREGFSFVSRDFALDCFSLHLRTGLSVAAATGPSFLFVACLLFWHSCCFAVSAKKEAKTERSELMNTAEDKQW